MRNDIHTDDLTVDHEVRQARQAHVIAAIICSVERQDLAPTIVAVSVLNAERRRVVEAKAGVCDVDRTGCLP